MPSSEIRTATPECESSDCVYALGAGPVSGQAVYRGADVNAEYRPLVYSKDGRIQGCGIHIIAGLSGGLALLGSLNFNVAGKVGIVWKLTAFTLDKKPVPLEFAGLDLDGLNLSSILHRFPSDDGLAYTAGVILEDRKMAEVAADMIGAMSLLGARITFRAAGHDFDRTAEIEPMYPAPPAFAEYRRCMATVGYKIAP